MRKKEIYEPVWHKQRLLKWVGIIGFILLAPMWYFHEKIGLDTSSLCILTGIGLLNLVLWLRNEHERKKCFRQSKELSESRKQSAIEYVNSGK